jgi:hypothetical protein
MSNNMTSVGYIPLDSFKLEYYKLLTPESQHIISFLKPYYNELAINQHPIPTLLLNWFKDTAMNYQNLLHTMTINQYTVTKVEEKIMSNDKSKAYHEQFKDEYENQLNNGSKIKVYTTGTTDFQTFGTPMSSNPNPQQIPEEWKKFLKMPTHKGGAKITKHKSHKKKTRKKQINYSNPKDFMHGPLIPSMDIYAKRLNTKCGQEITEKTLSKSDILSTRYISNSQLFGGGNNNKNHKRRFSRAKSMFRDFGNPDKYQNKINFLQDAKPYLIKALIHLYKEYITSNQKDSTHLGIIFKRYYQNMSSHTDELLQFLAQIKDNKVDLNQMANWVNSDAVLLVRGFSSMLSEDKLKLPYELNKRMMRNVYMYNEFCPLVIQDYVEKRLNKRYMYTVQVPSYQNNKNVKLSLEILSKSYFEPIEFPVFSEVKPSNIDDEYTKFLQSQQNQSGGGKDGKIRRRKNISFTMARLLLVQSLHLPWITPKNMNVKILLTSFKKQLPYKKNQKIIELGSKDVNSGSKYLTNINIWRQEELNKLLIHESVHHAEIDFQQDIGLSSFIEKNMALNPQSEQRLYESYTETCALLIHLMVTVYEMFLVHHKWDRYATQLKNHFKYSSSSQYEPVSKIDIDPRLGRRSKDVRYSKRRSGNINKTDRHSKKTSRKSMSRKSKNKKSKSGKSISRTSTSQKSKSHEGGGLLLENYSLDLAVVISEIKQVFMVMIRIEQLFSAFQTAKILHYFEFESFEEFLNPMSTSKRINQQTSVLSYFIIKGGFLNSIGKFVSFIGQMNPSGSEPVMNMKFRMEDKDNFKKLIQQCVIDNVAYHKTVNEFMTQIRRKNIYPKGSSSSTDFGIEKTLRMSSIEISDEIYEY